MYLALKAARAALICEAQGPPETQLGDGISVIMVWPAPSERLMWKSLSFSGLYCTSVALSR